MFFSIENRRGAGSPRPRGGRGFWFGLVRDNPDQNSIPPGPVVNPGPYSAPSAVPLRERRTKG